MSRPLFPLRHHHRTAPPLHAAACGLTAAMHAPLLYGRRALMWPTVSLSTDTTMGPSRHALAQMVVAGTITYLPAFPPPATRRASGHPSPGRTQTEGV